MAVKTYEQWEGDLSEYLQVGDYVDEAMVDHFVNVVPPATFTSLLIQLGEARCQVDGKSVYPTLRNTSQGWQYVGCCFRGHCETVA